MGEGQDEGGFASLKTPSPYPSPQKHSQGKASGYNGIIGEDPYVPTKPKKPQNHGKGSTDSVFRPITPGFTAYPLNLKS